MEVLMQSLREFNLVSIFLLLILLSSIFQGLLRGASRSAGSLLHLVSGGVLSLLGIAAAIPLTIWISPIVQKWLSGFVLPDRDLAKWEQVGYTVVMAVRDFPLMRFAVVFILMYLLTRSLVGLGILLLRGSGSLLGRIAFGGDRPATLPSRLLGAGIGTLIGATRCLVIIVLLFIVVTLFPNTEFSRYVEASPVYRQGAQSVIEPLTGSLIKQQLPVFTRGVEAELGTILQQKYEVIDAKIPEDIKQAAAEITKGAKTDEEKARLLYDWVGTKITYDKIKVKDYEQEGKWHEQSPQMTFDTKRGVCIDYARLFAVMARSQGIKVKVITGLGYDGQGSYGPHAWNEVYLPEKKIWIPLDSTWAKNGDWFNTPAFNETHIPDKLI